MPAIAVAYPILPGKLDAWKRFTHARQSEFDAFNRRMGLTVVRMWQQPTPQSDLVIVYQEGDDPAQFVPRIAAAHEPFDVWFKHQVLEIHGVDFSQPLSGPPPELVFEWEAR